MVTPAQKINLKDLIRTEYTKCVKDPMYFMKKYCMIQHPTRNRLLFNLYPYQEDVLKTFETEQHTIVLKARQIGLSTVVSMYALWLMLFFRDKSVIIIATKQETAKNIITKIRFALDNLPIWLQVKVVENNKLTMRFKNGSQIKASSSSEDAGRSESASLLIMDECLAGHHTIYIKNRITGEIRHTSLEALYNELSSTTQTHSTTNV